MGGGADTIFYLGQVWYGAVCLDASERGMGVSPMDMWVIEKCDDKIHTPEIYLVGFKEPTMGIIIVRMVHSDILGLLRKKVIWMQSIQEINKFVYCMVLQCKLWEL